MINLVDLNNIKFGFDHIIQSIVRMHEVIEELEHAKKDRPSDEFIEQAAQCGIERLQKKIKSYLRKCRYFQVIGERLTNKIE